MTGPDPDRPDPPEAIVRRLVPLYLRARDLVAATPAGHPDYPAARTVRDSLFRRLVVHLRRCLDRCLVVPAAGVRVVLESATGDLWVVGIGRRAYSANNRRAPARGRRPKARPASQETRP